MKGDTVASHEREFELAMDAHCRIHYLDDRCCFAQRGDVTVSIWHAPPTVALLETQRSVLERVIRQHGKFMAITSFRVSEFDPKTMRDNTLQTKIEALTKLIDGALLAHAIVVEGTGFGAALLRSSVTSLAFLLRSKVSSKAFDSIPPAAQWLGAKRADHDGESTVLTSFAAEITSKMNAAVSAVPAKSAS